MSKLHNFRVSQKIPISIDLAWDFITQPHNLKLITPPEISLDVINKSAMDKVRQGIIIHYRLKPLWGITFNWVSEIPHFEPKRYFVDQQKFGPYRFWHHQHFLSPVENGVEMVDDIDYKLPLGILGDILFSYIIRARLKKIFDFRRNKIEELFGKYPE